jgi:tetratricopeptide (TPR) repeat protein
MSESTESTQPIKVRKPSRLRANIFSVLGVLALLALSTFGGYRAAVGDRVQASSTVISQQLAEQFQFALVDIQFGRNEVAKQRLEFIINNDPSYPGAAQKLTEILVQMSVPTPTSTPLPSPTPNPTGAEGIFAQAQTLIAARDWPNALVALDEVRKADPGYKTGQVDGMYYFVLRNYGFDLITKQGNLEGGIYELTLAERFALLDNSAYGLREGARAYLVGASFWEINWEQAVLYLSQVAAGWPGLWDGTDTAGNRYFYALMRYGDELFNRNDMCKAVTQYETAATYGSLDETAAKHYNQAFQACYPPTEIAPTPTTEVVVPTVAPTEPPATETPTVTP